jgi:hypothetical protein
MGGWGMIGPLGGSDSGEAEQCCHAGYSRSLLESQDRHIFAHKRHFYAKLRRYGESFLIKIQKTVKMVL